MQPREWQRIAWQSKGIFMLYVEYMRSETWEEKRLKRLEIDKYECRLCGEKEQLEVHHKPNSYRKIPNESIENDLTTMCVGCHNLITDRIRRKRYSEKPIITKPHINNITKVNENERQVENIKVSPHRSFSYYLP